MNQPDLDAASADEILTLLAQLSKKFGKTVVMVTHDLHAAEYAGSVYHLEKGNLLPWNAADELSTRHWPMRPAMPPIDRENGLNTGSDNTHLHSSAGILGAAMAPCRVLGMYIDRGRRGHTSSCCTCNAILLRTTPTGRTGSGICLPRSSHVGAYCSGSGIRADRAIRIFRRFSSFTWPERWLFPLGVIVGMTAYAMSAYAVGGWTERSAVLSSTLILVRSGTGLAI